MHNALTILDDYRTILGHALATGNKQRAAEAVATMLDELRAMSRGLPHAFPDITGTNGVYQPPADLQEV